MFTDFELDTSLQDETVYLYIYNIYNIYTVSTIFCFKIKYARARAVTGWNIALDWNFGPNMYFFHVLFEII